MGHVKRFWTHEVSPAGIMWSCNAAPRARAKVDNWRHFCINQSSLTHACLEISFGPSKINDSIHRSHVVVKHHVKTIAHTPIYVNSFLTPPGATRLKGRSGSYKVEAWQPVENELINGIQERMRTADQIIDGIFHHAPTQKRREIEAVRQSYKDPRQSRRHVAVKSGLSIRHVVCSSAHARRVRFKTAQFIFVQRRRLYIAFVAMHLIIADNGAHCETRFWNSAHCTCPVLERCVVVRHRFFFQ